MDELQMKELMDKLKAADSNYAALQQNYKNLQDELAEAKSKNAENATMLQTQSDEHKSAMDELKNDIADMELKLAKPNNSLLETKEQREVIRTCVKSAVGQFLRGNCEKPAIIEKFGIEPANEKKTLGHYIDLQLKTLNLTNTGEGKEAVDQVLSMEIIERAREAYPIVGAVRQRNMPRDLREEVLVGYPNVQEGIENVAGSNIAETGTQTYAEVKNRIAKVNAKPRITDEALYGSDLDLYGHLLTLLDDEIGRWLVAQILFGAGTGKAMRGILSSNRLDLTNTTGEAWKPTIDATPANARDVDHYPALGTGVSGNLPATDVAIVDWVLEFEATLPTKYLQNAKWYMNRKTLKRFKTVRDADERPIFLKGYMGEPMSINGYPVVVDDTMPDLTAADAPFLIFGDLAQAFSMSNGDIDKMLIDPYSVDGCIVVKMDKEFFEMVGKNDAIIIGAATTSGA